MECLEMENGKAKENREKLTGISRDWEESRVEIKVEMGKWQKYKYVWIWSIDDVFVYKI